MFKRIICSMLAVLLIMSLPVFAASEFTDLAENHWGYPSVKKLVSDGTVNGYPDGSFRPTGLVKRSEFVKMMGEGSVMRDKDFSDLPATHWAYKYAMTSEFDVSNNKFEPEKPITREETIVLLYKRAGSPAENAAPSIVTNQAKNKEAVSWAYNNGIVLGDDGVNLRLDGNLSRVEAAALIIRARETDFSLPNKNFVDTADKTLLKNIFESFTIFDDGRAYSENATITVGELAKASLRLISDEYNVFYSRYSYSNAPSHKYGKDTAIMNGMALGEESIDAAYCDKAVTRADAVAMLSAAFIKRGAKAQYGNSENTFSDITSENSKKQRYLSYAFNNGILLNGDGSLGANKKLTHKDLAALLIQFDELYPSQTALSTKLDANGNYTKVDVRLAHSTKLYPSNFGTYKYIAANTPAVVYEKAINVFDKNESVKFAKDYKELFLDHLSKITKNVKSALGLELEFVLYPNLVGVHNNGYITVRALCKVVDVPKTPVLINTVFSAEDLVEKVDGFFLKGNEFFFEITTSLIDISTN